MPPKNQRPTDRAAIEVPSRGRHVNSGAGPAFQVLEIGHPRYVALVAADTAFWALVRKEKLADALAGGRLLGRYRRQAVQFAAEMEALRFGTSPWTVYFNPTDRCNLNCTYCYLPASTRRHGQQMPRARMLDALERLRRYFEAAPAQDGLPQVVFHGAEPLLNRKAVFEAIRTFSGVFRFGIQTNGTLLDEAAIRFLQEHAVSVGISLDAPVAAAADRTRRSWAGSGVYDRVVAAMKRLKDYPGWNVIATVTRHNIRYLPQMVAFLHAHHVPAAMLNVVRCTTPSARALRPADQEASACFLAALDRAYDLYAQTGRKLVIANFANTLLAILAPTARQLMCDISPCGAGRCFFAVTAGGDLFPCSEFIGLPTFRAGNIFEQGIDRILAGPVCRLVTGRRVEDIEPCHRCAIRHFCGAPCPAEAYALRGSVARVGGFCEFYEEQVRYAFRAIADRKQDAFLWDGWDRNTVESFSFSAP